LWQAEEQVLKTFHDHCPDAHDWLPQGDLAATSLIANQMKDMVDRGLLVKVSPAGDAPSYRLKFHHHLATLLADLQLPMEIRTNLQAWRQTRPDARGGEAGDGRGPLHLSDMLLLREMLRGDLGSETPSAVVVCSLWDGGIDAETGGLADRLGMDPLQVGDARMFPPEAGSPTRRLWKNATPEALHRALARATEGNRPLLLTGGIDLLREGLRQARSEPGQIVALGPYRLTDGRVRWWFQRARGVEFPTEQEYDRVYDLTAGIPFLVGVFDRFLLPHGPPPGGFNPGPADVQEVRQRFEESMRRDTFGFINGPSSRRLSEREGDLIRMVHIVSAELEGDPKLSFPEWLRDGWAPEQFGCRWGHIYGKRPFPPRYLDEPDDAISLEALLLLGLLPGRGGGEPAGRVIPLTPTDPIALLWPRLE
jgi:hypothetical protein